MTTAYFYLTAEGEALARRLSAGHPGDLYGKENFKENLRNGFSRYDYLVCIMATGIVVRILAPLIVHKTEDPGVVVLDQKGRHAISLLSGHLGGANELAQKMARLSGGEAVITTATDVAGELSFDTFAKAHNISIENIGMLKHISGALLDKKPVRVITNHYYGEIARELADGKLELLPLSCTAAKLESMPTVVIDEGFSFREMPEFPVLYLRPRTICAGIGCKRNMDGEAIEDALLTVLKKEGLSPLSLKCISTIPLKADEPGIHHVCERLSVPLTVIAPEEIEALDIDSLGIQTSSFVAEQTGLLSVSTASSYLASGRGRILKDKVKFKGITVALSQTPDNG